MRRLNPADHTTVTTIELRIEQQADGRMALGLHRESTPGSAPSELHVGSQFTRIIEHYMADYLKHTGEGQMAAGGPEADAAIAGVIKRHNINPDILPP